MSIYTNLHEKYGAAIHVAEFRLFILNKCLKSCDSCFYKRSGNHINTHSEALNLATQLKGQGYRLETCYLLPTDFFDNPENLATIQSDEIKSIIENFEYIGIASTLEGQMNFNPLVQYLEQVPSKLEVQINLVNERLFETGYVEEVKNNKKVLNGLLGDRVVFNLALNLGGELSDEEVSRVQALVANLSDDGVIEINFTFLYNERIKKDAKTRRLIRGFQKMNQLAEMYNRTEARYNERTFLRKPAFFFRGESVYISPMVPFDEYLFIDSPKYTLKEISFEGFVGVTSSLQEKNKLIAPACNVCDNLSSCLGKGYFMAAHEFNLPCFLEV